MHKPAALATLFSFFILMLALMGGCTSLGSQPVFSDDEGALRGYDPVSYFDEEQAMVGNRDILYHYSGAEFYFSSQENLRRFKAQPEQFLPQYGGYCAYGMSRNFVVSSDPNAFTLVGGKLYLNYSLKVRDTWLKDVPGNISKADRNWSKKLASNEEIKE